MTKPFLALAISALALTACMEVPQTAADLRTHPMTRGKTVQVTRSASAAYNTIVSRAAACMNFNTTTHMTRMGGSPGQGMNAIISNTYRTKTQSSGNVRSLVIENYNPATIGNPGWYPYLLVDVIPAGGGAQVTTYSGIGNGFLTDPIESWAAGDTRPCPKDDI